MKFIINQYGVKIPYSKVIDSAARFNRPYTMDLNKSDAERLSKAINQGIDSHLEACFVPNRGDKYVPIGDRMRCEISQESLPVLIRRLYEDEDSRSHDLANGILWNLGFEV